TALALALGKPLATVALAFPVTGATVTIPIAAAAPVPAPVPAAMIVIPVAAAPVAVERPVMVVPLRIVAEAEGDDRQADRRADLGDHPVAWLTGITEITRGTPAARARPNPVAPAIAAQAAIDAHLAAVRDGGDHRILRSRPRTQVEIGRHAGDLLRRR